MFSELRTKQMFGNFVNAPYERRSIGSQMNIDHVIMKGKFLKLVV